jgi:uncharacterized protein YndB with AHSA1/START domain
MRPGDTTHAVARVDARVGGRFEIVKHGAQAHNVHRGVYRVNDRPRQLVITWLSAATQNAETLVSVDIRAHHRGTEIVLTHRQLPDAGATASHRRGWTQIVDGLAAHFERAGADSSNPPKQSKGESR